MSEDKNRNENSGMVKPKKDWFAIVTTTVVGAIITLGVAWYQINSSQEQAFLAERERAKAVKNELVRIVEDHVINGKLLDVSRLSRLVDYRSREEGLFSHPLVGDIVRGAEFNIFKSQYLEFDKKEEYKNVFDRIYQELSLRSDFSYSGINENIVNELYFSIQRNDTALAIENLSQLLKSFNEEISESKSRKSIRADGFIGNFISAVYEERLSILALFMAYFVLSIAFVRLIKHRRDVERKRELMEREFLFRKIKIDKDGYLSEFDRGGNI